MKPLVQVNLDNMGLVRYEFKTNDLASFTFEIPSVLRPKLVQLPLTDQSLKSLGAQRITVKTS